jgi:hypothetical protein
MPAGSPRRGRPIRTVRRAAWFGRAGILLRESNLVYFAILRLRSARVPVDRRTDDS